MSRVGKLPIPIPQGVTASLKDDFLTVKGPKGTLSRNLPRKIEIDVQDGFIVVRRQDDTKESKSLHGLVRALVSNMVVGVSTGFTKSLAIQGTGYRAEVQNDVLNLNIGYSNPVKFTLPAGINASVDSKQNVIQLEGVDKELLGLAAAQIRELRAVEPYKGKGIRYVGERVLRKAGKTGSKK